MTLSGEVGHPGTYGLATGERLSSVLERAGGLRETAYPQGAVFKRVRVRLGEKARLDLCPKGAEAEDLATMTGSGTGTAQEQMETLQSMRQQQQEALTALRNQPASGRLVIEISSDISKWKK